jgi:hypothetical protein
VTPIITTTRAAWTFTVGRRGQEDRAKRAVYRHAAVLVLSALLSLYAGRWTLTVWPVLVVSLAVHRTWVYVRDWKLNRHVVTPAVSVLSPVIAKSSPSGQGLVRLDVPRGFRDNEDSKIVVHLPMDWTPAKADMSALSTLLGQRLNTDSLTASWTLRGRKPHVTFAMPPKPPDTLGFTDMLTAADSCPDTQLVCGQGTRGQVCTFDLSLESPHLLLGAGSGAGKSEFLAWLVGQFMRRGYGVLVLDAKFISHMWLRRVPGVLYAAESAELHEALTWLDGELLRRARFVSAGGDPAALTPLVAVLEEMNGAANRLRRHWKDELGGKGASPALTALGNLANMGRELRVHILMAGQSMTARAVGGPEARESFGGRALARATANQWKMLAPQIKPAPVKSAAPGRWHLVVQDTVKEFQVPFVDIKSEPGRLIEWATGGTSIPDVPAMMMGVGGGGRIAHPASSEPPTPHGVTLRDYAGSRPGVELGTLLRWRERRDDFPAPVADGERGSKLYDPADLDLFVLTRAGG